MSTVVLLAHPDFASSRANRALLAGLSGMSGLEIAELYALYPDGHIDSAIERERLLRAERLVFQFPLQWYSVPALLKQWMDTVLTPLFYLEPEIAASTAGLALLAATTTGGPSGSYNSDSPFGMRIDGLFAPLRATAVKCKWRWQPPFALHDVRNLDKAAFEQAAATYKAAVSSTPMLAPRVSKA